MNFQKPYRFEVKEKKAILINGSTEKAEYEIKLVDIELFLLAVTAIYDDKKIKIPFSMVEKSDMKLIKYHFAEYII